MTPGCGATAALRVDNEWLIWVVITIAGLGIGGIVVRASIISQIVTPPDLIATVTALTLAIRVIGGAIAYTIYYNVFYQKLVYAAEHLFLVPETVPLIQASVPMAQLKEVATKVVQITVSGLLPALRKIPGLQEDAAYQHVVLAGRVNFAYAYKYVYYVSIAFGGVSIACALFLGDISRFMNDDVAAAYA